MTGIRNLLFNGFQGVLDFLGSLLLSVWSSVLLLLDAVLALVVVVIGAVGLLLVALFQLLLGLLLALMPAIPAPSESLNFSPVAFANAYVPIAEALALLPFMAAAVAMVGFYKLAKFIRGGG